jgi:hypothetical protein
MSYRDIEMHIYDSNISLAIELAFNRVLSVEIIIFVKVMCNL